MSKRFFLLPRLLLAVFFACVSLPLAAFPAFWTVEDEDTTVYLLGTIHLLDENPEWFTPTISGAFHLSERLWLELDLFHDFTILSALVTKGTSPDRPLKARLEAEDYQRLEAMAAKIALPMAAIEHVQPGLAAAALTERAAAHAGYQAEFGADFTLAQNALINDKPVSAFETGREQIALLTDLPEEVQITFLRETVRALETDQDLFTRLVAAWRAGDLDALETFAVDELKRADLALYERLIVKRNKAWAARFDEIMAGASTQFVAVGAGHLVGEEGLPALLAAKGLKVTRLEHGVAPQE